MKRKEKYRMQRNKGYILLESLIGISLGIIILTILISTFKLCDKLFYEKIKYKRNMVDIEECLHFIEHETMENVIKIEIIDNNIIIHKEIEEKDKNGIKSKYKITKLIKQIDNNLFVLNKEGWNTPEDTTYKNYIIRNIKNFKTKKVGDLFWVEIESNEGIKYERWYSLEKSQNIKTDM